MSKPFQFSICRMLAATALFGAVICLLRVAFGPHSHPSTVGSAGALVPRGWDAVARGFAVAGATWCLIAGIGAITETNSNLTRALALLGITLIAICLPFVYYQLK